MSTSTGSADTTEQQQPQQPKATPKSGIIQWKIRPATLLDRDGCTQLLQQSYQTLLANDYSADCLTTCLPLITQPRDELLTCNTWYVVEHPSTQQLVGCGGWTVSRPKPGDAKVEVNASSQEVVLTSSSPPPHLRHFGTHPEFLRMGIASLIWQRCQADIQVHYASENLSFPTLEVISTLTAESFYKSLGFEPVKHLDIELVKGTTFPSILMRRDSPPE